MRYDPTTPRCLNSKPQTQRLRPKVLSQQEQQRQQTIQGLREYWIIFSLRLLNEKKMSMNNRMLVNSTNWGREGE